MCNKQRDVTFSLSFTGFTGFNQHISVIRNLRQYFQNTVPIVVKSQILFSHFNFVHNVCRLLAALINISVCNTAVWKSLLSRSFSWLKKWCSEDIWMKKLRDTFFLIGSLDYVNDVVQNESKLLCLKPSPHLFILVGTRAILLLFLW